MKKTTVLFFSMLMACACFSQHRISDTKTVADSRYGDSLSVAAIPTPEELLVDILKATGIQHNNFQIKSADVLNIEATIHHKKRFIYYNPEFIRQLNVVTKSKWALATLLAHEVGHHLNGHTIKRSGSRVELELEADEFAGFIMNKMGASLEEAQQVMFYVSRPSDSKTHPGQKKRVNAIKSGWEKANNPPTP